jgi:glycosyltransferase involved in cell wall biosynthesis
MTINKPLVSIITPSFNCHKYIEGTIRSVLGQNYPNIEHIIVDGASSDNTLDILMKYDRKIKWISEPDSGMYDAVNKGFAMANGEILTYINADDQYDNSNTIGLVVNEFHKNPSVDFTYGYCAFTNEDGEILYVFKTPPFYRKIATAFPRNVFHQPTCFWRKRVHMGFDNSFRYCGDSYFFRHLCKKHVGKNIPHIIAKFMVREDCISFQNRERMSQEDKRVFGREAERKVPLYLKLVDLFYIRTYLNLSANIKRLSLHRQGRPYL